MDEQLQLAVIIGSTRVGRVGDTVARWVAARAEARPDMVVDLVDLAELDLPASYPDRPGPAVEAFVARIDRADAFVVVTPEYNHGYPASLKQAIDLPYGEWHGKAVGFVSYGGVSGGLRAVEQLRQVFAELQTVTVRETVSFHQVWGCFDADGQPHEPDRCGATATTMLDQLAWWAGALRPARAALAVG